MQAWLENVERPVAEFDVVALPTRLRRVARRGVEHHVGLARIRHADPADTGILRLALVDATVRDVTAVVVRLGLCGRRLQSELRVDIGERQQRANRDVLATSSRARCGYWR